MRYPVSISEKQYEALVVLAKMNKTAVAEEIRRAIDYWLADDYKPTQEFQRN